MSNKRTIKEIKELLFDQTFSEKEWIHITQDERKGVQKLVQQYINLQEEKHRLKQQFEKMRTYEERYYSNGKWYIAGVDEAGRGPLAGPVVAGAVLLNHDFYLAGLNDSKQLSEKKRESYFTYIQENALSFGIGIVNSEKIDKINIYEATKLAMTRAIEQLRPQPEHVLIDAVPLHELNIPFDAITKGDQQSVSIAAASILAKVTRDRLMRELHECYPMYQFASNMGYGTQEHINAIQKHGITPYHRKSFAPVKNVTIV